MLFFFTTLTRKLHILILSVLVLAACSGSRKYFKAAERLEKQGLVSDAAEYYLESLQRKPTNVEARIKLKEVGQKHLSGMASEFFRNYNTQQLEASLESYERLKAFSDKTSALDVHLDYPKAYDEDYAKAIETYCGKNYEKGHLLVNQKKYGEALTYLRKVEKYNGAYKQTKALSVIATCEPLYQSAVTSLENKNYAAALNQLGSIHAKTDNYKDSQNLLELAKSQLDRSFILFKPNPSADNNEREEEEFLYNNFNQVALQRLNNVKIINNSPFQNTTGTATDLFGNANVDLVQAIRKATGADYFYVYDVANMRQYNPGPSRTVSRAFEEIKTRKNDTLVITEYKAFDYNVVKAQRSFTYDFKYKIINAYTNQVVSTQVQSLRSQDAIEYQEFQQRFNGNINTLFPYNPHQTLPNMQYNPRAWRNLFSARNTLKSMDELRKDAFNQNVTLFLNSAGNMK